jgi:hypothetical protein
MAKITLKGNPIHTSGELPSVGSPAPDFVLTTGGLEDVSLAAYAGKKKILNIVPSLDTGVCAASARRFDQEVAGMADNRLPDDQRRSSLCVKPLLQGRGYRQRDHPQRDAGPLLREGLRLPRSWMAPLRAS